MNRPYVLNATFTPTEIAAASQPIWYEFMDLYPSFTADLWTHTAEGDWATVKCGRTIERSKLREAFDTVIIDGHQYKVKAIHSHAVITMGPHSDIAFLVERRITDSAPGSQP